MIGGKRKLESYALAGIALDTAQSLENILQLVLTWVLQKEGDLTIFLLETESKAARKKTLGQFMVELRKRTGVHKELDTMLDSFLDRRNMLAHRLDDIPGWKRETAEDFDQVEHFLKRLILDSGELIKIFAALTREWQKETMPDADLPGTDLVDEFTEHYRPFVDNLFFKKE